MTTKRAHFSGRRRQHPSQQGDYGHLAKLQTGGGGPASEGRQVVFERTSDFLHQPVFAKTPQHGRYLPAVHRKAMLKVAVAKSRYSGATIDDRPEYIQVGLRKEVEAAKAAIIFPHRARELVQIAYRVGRIVDRRYEIQIPAVGRQKQSAQVHQAVDRFLHGRHLARYSAVPVFHLPVVLEKGDIVGRRFHPKHQPVFVVHLDGHLPHVMLDAGALDAGGKVVAQFVPVSAMGLSPQKSRHPVGLDAVNGGSRQFGVQVRQLRLPVKNDIRGVFDLHQAPMVGVERFDDRAVARSDRIEEAMEIFRLEPVAESLRRIPIVALHKGVVQQGESNAFVAQHGRQGVVPVKVELKPKRCPSRHAQIAQPELGQDKVEVIMQAFGGGGLQKGAPGLFVVPGRVAGTRLHRRKHVNQSGMLTTGLQDLTDPLLLAEIVLPDELDRKTGLGSQPLGVFPDLVAKRFGPFGVVEDPDAVGIQKAGHALGIANAGNRAGDHNPIPAGEHSCNFVRVPLEKQIHGGYPPCRVCFHLTPGALAS